MDVESITQRHGLLLEELKRRISALGRWNGVPALLDELHSLRCAYNAALAEAA